MSKNKRIIKNNDCHEVIDEVFPDVEHDIEGVTFEGKPLSYWSLDAMIDRLEDD